MELVNAIIGENQLDETNWFSTIIPDNFSGYTFVKFPIFNTKYHMGSNFIDTMV